MFRVRYKKFTRAFVVGLTTIILTISVITPYQKASTAKAFVGVDDAAIGVVLLFMAAAGAVVSYDYLNDGNNALDLVDDYQEYYEEQRLKVLEGGGGTDPDNIPPWEDLVNSASLAGTMYVTMEMFNIAKEYSNSKMYGRMYALGGKLADSHFQEGNVNLTAPFYVNTTYPVSFSQGYSTYNTVNSEFLKAYFSAYDSGILVGSSTYSNASGTRFVSCSKLESGYDSILVKTQDVVAATGPEVSYSVLQYNSLKGYTKMLRSCNAVVSSSTLLNNWGRYDWLDYSSNYSSQSVCLNPAIKTYYQYGSGEISEHAQETIWVHPDIEKTYKNDGKFDVYPPYNPLQLPTEKLLQALQQAMNDSDELPEDEREPARDKALLDYFNEIGLDDKPTQKPDKPVDPGTDPDPGIDPDPDPGIDPDPDPDDLTQEQKKSFLLPESIKDKFPFCVPFDIIEAFTVLKSDTREAPRIVIPLKAEKYGIDYTFDIDLSVYDEQAKLLRTLELLLFIVGLAFVTRGLIKG